MPSRWQLLLLLLLRPRRMLQDSQQLMALEPVKTTVRVIYVWGWVLGSSNVVPNEESLVISRRSPRRALDGRLRALV